MSRSIRISTTSLEILMLCFFDDHGRLLLRMIYFPSKYLVYLRVDMYGGKIR